MTGCCPLVVLVTCDLVSFGMGRSKFGLTITRRDPNVLPQTHVGMGI